MRKGNWKADEMEMMINFKSIRLSWIFSELSLVIYCFVEMIRTGDLPAVPFLILCVSGVIFFAGKLLMTRRLAEENDDEE